MNTDMFITVCTLCVIVAWMHIIIYEKNFKKLVGDGLDIVIGLLGFITAFLIILIIGSLGKS